MDENYMPEGFWARLWFRIRESVENFLHTMGRLGRDTRTVGSYLYKLRAIILAAPIAAIAAVLAAQNMNRLPEMVEITTLAIDPKSEEALLGFLVVGAGEITRAAAVYGPLAITLVCLVLTLFSKRVLYPVLISVFTLGLPLFLRLTNDPQMLQGVLDSLGNLLLPFLE